MGLLEGLLSMNFGGGGEVDNKTSMQDHPSFTSEELYKLSQKMKDDGFGKFMYNIPYGGQKKNGGHDTRFNRGIDRTTEF